ncbi:hypothetical protein [Candidatus Soleaferrea massiliensis]|uniref:hypothetical protein n=1 Tax=Candidatus Soleaferrea massiliensis TaxID=1470354 RepID=UPI00058B535C|nr:hypothetical protein [Candidatus Soleaferrea massiliensis]
MKKIIAISAVGVFLFGCLYWIGHSCKDFNISFATHVYVSYEEDGNTVSKEITDTETVAELKEIFQGQSYIDVPIQSFSDSCYLVFSDNQDRIEIYPAQDSETVMRINKENRFLRISEEGRKEVDRILKNYAAV